MTPFDFVKNFNEYVALVQVRDRYFINRQAYKDPYKLEKQWEKTKKYQMLDEKIKTLSAKIQAYQPNN